ncbi:S9 family peptidase [Actinomycetospora cinnamomea]|uniref:Dipeptidyl aminopeptidase/acylaminoacyl peptidase n=1 Tax=Actinomycetospora cinnamomea TaxID=663609 RepID=A0A2U1FBA8_9PSEU|nr:prolyl oligopeptidase family serine peptidase [Actinomycetospora cinnamomea]PVZ09419.1 dipeptidyl aminopeptidase/acylaminoacyl peptidase [Actinomycetospora cinnamomea]
MTSSPARRPDPVPDVPEALFADPGVEARWRGRFTAARVSVPDWARDAPDRSVYSSNATGTWEIYAWDRAADTHRRVTDRPHGTRGGAASTDGTAIWWFDDTDGDEFGVWVREPFEGGDAVPAVAGAVAGYPAGLDLGRRTVAVGWSTDDGSTLAVSEDDGSGFGEARVLYAHTEDAGIGALSRDETLLAISHAEHGDSRHPAVRVVRVADGGTVGERHDGEGPDGQGRGLDPIEFAPVEGDQRLLVGHERRGRDELLIWDLATDTETELDIGLPGDLSAGFYPDATALLVAHTRAGRTTLHRYDLATGELGDLPTAPGSVGGADVRPDGTIEYGWSSAAYPSSVRALRPDGTDTELLAPPGDWPAPSVALDDAWVDGPGGSVHALWTRPDGTTGPVPTVFMIHGGPQAADEDRWSPVRAVWVDAGFAVVHVNYRGSSGYGSAWRDAIEGRPGTTELEDIAAVHDWAVSTGLADPAACVLEGWSWGGYLTLLGLGRQPERWAVGCAGVPVADYLAAYADEMEPLRAFDRSLFGGSPTEVPERYREASPLTWVDAVRAPVLVLAGENDPRCPIRQIDNYLDALAERGREYAMVRYDAGHGSLVVAETLRHTVAEIAFARRALGLPVPA